MRHRQTNTFDPKSFEQKWNKIWREERIYESDINSAAKPYYNLMMFPYPSAEGLHIGNMYAFCGADIHGRFKRLQGYDVFEPIGLDGFGIHSENYAIKVGKHPKELSAITQENFYRQLGAIGNAYSWEHTVETYNPNYYKWTQWLFVKMFKAGLAYRKEAPVNWCPGCKTVLADEQVLQKSKFKNPNSKKEESVGVCERCGSEVEVKNLSQWFFRITSYAHKLLENTKKLNWPEKVLVGQRNWIGESEGAEIIFKLEGRDIPIHVFTTRLDTIYGVTALVIGIDKKSKDGKGSLALEIASSDRRKEVEEYINKISNLQFLPAGRQGPISKDKQQDVEKTGVFTGAYAVNPFSGERVPVWVANYVVGWYGTGALMVVPAHDERDYEFAKKYGIPIKQVVKPTVKTKAEIPENSVFTGPGLLVDSEEYSGLTSDEAVKKMISFLEDTQSGMAKRQYKLRDWIISRQRYWGAPIPMIYCAACAKNQVKSPASPAGREKLKVKSGNDDWNSYGWFPVEENELPVLLPEVTDWRPKGTGKSPLASATEFVNVNCPHCGLPAERETDVCDTFLDSSWYYLRYPSVNEGNSKFLPAGRHGEALSSKIELPWDPEITRKWLPVNQYTGGAEHAVLHLLYSRFVTMALYDMGYLHFEEPFPNFFAHGLIIKDGAKMSKSKGNVVIPDNYINKYGSDSLRCYLMFLGPFEAGGDFRDSGMYGMARFLKRVWNLYHQAKLGQNTSDKLRIKLHKTIKKASEDLVRFKYNTTISAYMELVNEWSEEGATLAKADGISFLIMLSPFAPYMTEELYQEINPDQIGVKRSTPIKSGSKDQPRSNRGQKINGYASIHEQKWPEYDEQLVVDEKVTIAIQVNGKLRAQIVLTAEQAQLKEVVIEVALKEERVAKYIKDKLQVKKEIFVPGKIINFVI